MIYAQAPLPVKGEVTAIASSDTTIQPETFPSEPSWILGGQGETLSVLWHEGEQRWSINFKCRDGRVIASAFSPLELTTILHAIGTKRLWPRTETELEAIARGLKITQCPTMFATGGDTPQSWRRKALPPSMSEKRKSELKFTPSQLANLTLEDLI